MQHNTFIFDMDGTLCDSRPGILNGLNQALSHFGFPILDENEVLAYIGPPLPVSIRRLTGFTAPEKVEEVLQHYRDYYTKKGIYELNLYPGIEQTLKQLKSRVRLGVCTSKRQEFASQIVQNVQLDQYFEFVSGSSPGQAKWEQLATLLKEKTITTDAVMIGDRLHDIEAAQKTGLTSIGVQWGYGEKNELLQAGADYLVTSPEELLTLFPVD